MVPVSQEEMNYLASYEVIEERRFLGRKKIGGGFGIYSVEANDSSELLAGLVEKT